MIYLIASLVLLLLEYTISNNIIDSYFHHEDNYEYPQHIPIYEIRRDVHSKKHVEKNRIQLLGGFNRNNITHDKVTLKEFQKTLQCSLNEPELNGRRGSKSLYKLLPMTRLMIERVCAFLQTECSPWKACHDKIEILKNSKFEKQFLTASPYQARLLRVIGNQLYYDWPWGFYQEGNKPNDGMLEIIHSVISRVSDIGDSVFLFGEEISFLPSNIPMPSFSWYEAYSFEKNKIIDPAMNVSFNQIVDWEKKLPKAVFYGTLRKDRQIFYDLAAKRPDLIEGKWNSGGEYLHPWNPASNESKLESEDPRLSKTANQSISDEEQEIGTLKNLLKVKINQGVPYIAANYKFVVVLTGDAGFSTSGRLSILLAHSGSVVLVQDHDMVHYVPLSFTASDIIDKIEFLISNDHVARRIALNARNFGISHLRYEDYLCYVAKALNTVSNITSTTDANMPFNATKIQISDNVYY